MYKAKPFLVEDSVLSLYFSYIHSYINYANLAWASTHKINLKKIHSQQKHPLKTKFDHDRYYLKTVFDHDRYYLKTVFDHDRYYLKTVFDHDRYYLKTVFDHDRYYLKTVFDHDRYYDTKELFRSGNVLNVYKLNLLNISIFMQK